MKTRFLWSKLLTLVVLLVILLRPILTVDAGSINRLNVVTASQITINMVKDINPNALGSGLFHLTPFGDKLFFYATDGVNGYEPWISDGTLEGTYQLAETNPGGDAIDSANAKNYASPIVLNGMLYFVAKDATDRSFLWRTNGTKGNAEKVDSQPRSPSLLKVLGNEVFIFTTKSAYSWTLSKTSGSGITLVREFVDEQKGWEAAAANGWLFFFTYGTGSGGTKLWKTNGILTEIVKPFPLETAYAPGAIVSANNLVFFAPPDAVYGIELWQSDGQTTQLVQDLDPINMFFIKPVGANDTLYYYGNGSTEETSGIYRTRGKSTGIEKVTSLTATWLKVSGDHVYFRAEMGTNGGKPLARFVGSLPGTGKDVETLVSSGGIYNASDTNDVAEFRGAVFFSATDATHGKELWISDGTMPGARLLKDLQPGSTGSSPSSFFVINGRLLFVANDGVNGEELWSLQMDLPVKTYLPITVK